MSVATRFAARQVALAALLAALVTPAAAQTRGGAAPSPQTVRGRRTGVVLPPQSSAPSRVVPLQTEGATLDPRLGVILRASATPAVAYVGQQITYEAGVFLDDDIVRRLRRNPEFIPPEPRAMLAYELPAGPTSTTDIIAPGGKRYEAHRFRRAYFPLTAGTRVLPSAQLAYALRLTPGFFGREESFVMRSDSVVVAVREPPTAGRPRDWLGAVGAVAVDARLDSADARVGDPLVLTVTVRGRGNVKLWPRPDVALGWGTLVPAGDRVVLDSASAIVSGRKEFDWIVTPTREGPQRLPSLRYAHFDPERERYEVAETDALAVDVRPGQLASATASSALDPARDAAVPRALTLRTVMRAPVGAPWTLRPEFWLLLVTAPLPAAAIAVVRRPRRAPPPVAPAIALRALARSRRPTSALEVRVRFVRAISARVRVAPAAFASAPAFERALRREGVTAAAAAEASALLAQMDSSAFAPQTGEADVALGRRAYEVYARIEREARAAGAVAEPAPLLRPRRNSDGKRLPLVLFLLATAATAHAAAPTDGAARDAFGVGLRAYAARDYVSAAEEFRTSAAIVPRAADAWANLGTAAWAAGDSAAAAEGWQRALRLEPRAADARERLALLGSTQEGSIAEVPGVPASFAAALAMAAWLGAWTLLAFRAAGRAPGAGSWGVALGAVAIASGTLAVELDVRYAARDLAVVRTAQQLRALPALGADSGATVRAADIARVERRVGVWSSIALGDGRSGWIPTDALTPLARD